MTTTKLTAEQLLDAAKHRIKVKKLGLQETTPEGRWWVEIDGEKIGQSGRAFWKSSYQAWRCGWNYLKSKVGVYDDKY